MRPPPKIFGGAGSYAEQHVADLDLVGRKPRNLTHVYREPIVAHSSIHPLICARSGSHDGSYHRLADSKRTAPIDEFRRES